MGSFFSRDELARRMISNGEFTPMPQSELQRRFEARLYKVRQQAAAGELDWTNDRFAALKTEYERSGGVRSNRAYGYVA